MGMLGGGTTAAATYRKGRGGAHHHAGGGLADGQRDRGDDFGRRRDRRGQADADPAGRVHPERRGICRAWSTARCMISVGGDASVEDKTAVLETMDFKALGDF